MTINNAAGDSLGKNTDGFDIGESSNVIITGSNVYNQDDCVAVNSGTVSRTSRLFSHIEVILIFLSLLRSKTQCVQAAMVFQLAQSAGATTILWKQSSS